MQNWKHRWGGSLDWPHISRPSMAQLTQHPTFLHTLAVGFCTVGGMSFT